jgi:AraC-like DNA-binding protein
MYEETTTHSLDEWQALVAASSYPLAVYAGPQSFTASVRQVQLPMGVSVAEVRTDDYHLRRDSRLVRASETDNLLVLLKLHGAARAHSADASWQVSSGGAVLFDPCRPYDIISDGRCHELVLACPRTLLPELAGEDRTALRMQLTNSPSVRVLRAVLRELTATDTEAVDLHEQQELSTTVVDLLGVMMRAYGRQREQLSCSAATELRVLQAFALRKLADTRLSVETMAAAHTVSVRHVSAVFHKAGLSPASYIRSQPLARSRADLTNPRHAHRSVAEIGRAWGFYDMTTFSRAFRRAYSELPSEVRKSGSHP